MQKLLQLSDNLTKFVLAAVLIIVPLFPKFPLIRISGTYVAIRFEDVLLLVLGICVVVKIAPKVKEFWQDKIIRALVIFFGIGIASVVSGAFLTQTIDFKIGLLHLLRRVEYTTPFFAGLALLPRGKISEIIDFFIKILMIVISVAFVYGVGQRYLKFPIIITQNEEYSKGVALFWTPGSHINSTFAGHYDLAAFMVLLLPVFLTLFFLLRGKFSRMFLLIASVSGLWLLISSVSRISQVSYLFAVTIAFLLLRKFKELALVLSVSIALIALSGNLVARFQRIFEVYADEPVATIAPTPKPTSVFEDRSTSIRLNVEWPRAIRAFKKNPVLGTGYSSITLATDNDYLRLLGEIGVLGFISFFLVFLRIGQVFLSALPLPERFSGIELGFIAGVVGGLGGTFLSATFIDLFEASKFAIILWLLLGCAVVLVRSRSNVQKI